MDIDTIEGGEDFTAVIEEKIKECDALVAVIGKRWLTSTGQNGGRRLDDSRDYVRLEIAKALIRGIRVIPVLVGGATIPEPNDLPEELVPLSGRQAIELRDAHFHQDTQRLIDVLYKAVPYVVEQPGTSETDPCRPLQTAAAYFNCVCREHSGWNSPVPAVQSWCGCTGKQGISGTDSGRSNSIRGFEEAS